MLLEGGGKGHPLEGAECSKEEEEEERSCQSTVYRDRADAVADDAVTDDAGGGARTSADPHLHAIPLVPGR